MMEKLLSLETASIDELREMFRDRKKQIAELDRECLEISERVLEIVAEEAKSND